MTQQKKLKWNDAFDLYPSPDNSRLRYTAEKIVELTTKIFFNGFMTSKPLLVTKEGEILQGNRRYICAIFAEYARSLHPHDSVDQDMIDKAVRDALGSMGSPAGESDHRDPALIVARKLKDSHSVKLPCIQFSGNAKQKAVTFFDATGTEPPDLLGEAWAIRRAIKAGWKEAELSNHFGKGISYINNRIAITEVDPDLAAAIDAKTYTMGVATALAKLPQHKRGALTRYVLSFISQGGKSILTTATISEVAKQVDDFDGFQLPLEYSKQSERNVAQILAAMWVETVTNNPDSAWAAVVQMVRSKHATTWQTPWLDSETAQRWIDLLVGPPPGGRYMPVMLKWLFSVSCEACAVHKLPADTFLDVDLPLACRSPRREKVKEVYGKCINGFRISEAVVMNVPDSWAGNDGVEVSGTTQMVKSETALQQAWHSQLERETDAKEAARREEEEAIANTRVELPQVDTPDTDEETATETAVPAPPDEGDPEPVEMTLTPVLDDEEPQRPIDDMRDKLRTYIALHQTMPDSDNVVAAQCVRCRYRMDDGGCEWAASSTLRTVRFSQLTGEDKTAVPFCHQYRPAKPWREIVPDMPDWDAIDGYPDKSLMIETVLQMVEARKLQNKSDVQMYQWLTGRPMNTTENYQTWFVTELDQQGRNLRVSQVAFLYMMVMQEFLRTDCKPFQIPIFDGETLAGWETVSEGTLIMDLDI